MKLPELLWLFVFVDLLDRATVDDQVKGFFGSAELSIITSFSNPEPAVFILSQKFFGLFSIDIRLGGFTSFWDQVKGPKIRSFAYSQRVWENWE